MANTRIYRGVLIGVMVALAGTALAHSGVQNAAVKARMHAMNQIGADTKVLGQMAKGETGFDAAAARAAAARIAQHAGQTPALFEAREDDPKSEARPEIWADYADFTARAHDLERVAGDLSRQIAAPADLRAAIPMLAGACKACHSKYRE